MRNDLLLQIPNPAVLVSSVPFWAVMVSLLAAVLIVVSGRRPNLREGWTLAAAVIKFCLVCSMLPSVMGGNVVEHQLVEIAPGISFGLRVDALGLYFALIASGLWILT